jgi:ribosomal protein L29
MTNMKKDTLQNLRGKSAPDLSKDLQAAQDKLWQLRSDVQGGKVTHLKEMRSTKKMIAVIKTLMGENKPQK